MIQNTFVNKTLALIRFLEREGWSGNLYFSCLGWGWGVVAFVWEHCKTLAHVILPQSNRTAQASGCLLLDLSPILVLGNTEKYRFALSLHCNALHLRAGRCQTLHSMAHKRDYIVILVNKNQQKMRF